MPEEQKFLATIVFGSFFLMLCIEMAAGKIFCLVRNICGCFQELVVLQVHDIKRFLRHDTF